MKSFLELSEKIYPDLVKVFFTNLEFKNDVLISSIKGVQMEINKRAWKDVVGLKPRGVQVRKGETGAIPEFNKMQYYGQCLRNPTNQALPCWWSQGGSKASCYDSHKNHSSTW